MTFFPRSLSGQIALVMTAALLLASAVNFALLLSERARAGLSEASGPALARHVDFVSDIIASPPGAEIDRQPSRRRGGHFSVDAGSVAERPRFVRQPRLERRLRQELEEAGIAYVDAHAAIRPPRNAERPREQPPGDTAPAQDANEAEPASADASVRRPARRPGANGRRGPEIGFSTQLADGRWVSATFHMPPPPEGEVYRLGASTFILFAFILAAALWMSRRLSRPLHDLTQAASRVGAAAEPYEVEVRGPSDVQQTLEAFNAMSRRVTQLLGEKDVMLGALGHDLRTPLSSLRIRLETMEPKAERHKAIRTIEETTLLLEAILDLARQGRSSEPVQNMDVSILIQDIVEDYAETGAPVSLAASMRSPAPCRPILLTRLMRNLIDNAVAYGGAARVSVGLSGGQVELSVEDDGPGMSPDALAVATRPFVRGDASRNSGTGGSGLGLALADAIAKAHGGSLTLENRSPKGLLAKVRIPAVPALVQGR